MFILSTCFKRNVSTSFFSKDKIVRMVLRDKMCIVSVSRTTYYFYSISSFSEDERDRDFVILLIQVMTQMITAEESTKSELHVTFRHSKSTESNNQTKNEITSIVKYVSGLNKLQLPTSTVWLNKHWWKIRRKSRQSEDNNLNDRKKVECKYGSEWKQLVVNSLLLAKKTVDILPWNRQSDVNIFSWESVRLFQNFK